MTEPTTTGGAAALAVSAGGSSLLAAFNNIPLNEYLPGTLFALIGAVAWQFIVAQAAREKAAAAGVPQSQRPTIDLVTVAYSLVGAPLVASSIIAIVHMFGGTATVLSLPGFMVGGAAGPTIVQRAVGLLLAVLPTTKGGGT